MFFICWWGCVNGVGNIGDPLIGNERPLGKINKIFFRWLEKEPPTGVTPAQLQAQKNPALCEAGFLEKEFSF